jgi:hypothetical protein
MVLVVQGKAAGVEQQPAPQTAQSRPWLRASAELGVDCATTFRASVKSLFQIANSFSNSPGRATSHKNSDTLGKVSEQVFQSGAQISADRFAENATAG